MENKIIEKVREFVEEECKKPSSKYGFEPYIAHFVPMVKRAKQLAKLRNVDEELIEIAAWLHDIGSIVFGRENHHFTGMEIAEKKLIEFDYPLEKINIVKKCILNHRGSINNYRESVEEQIIAEADSLNNFDNIAGIFKAAFVYENKSQLEARDSVKEKLIRKFNQLSVEGKKLVQDKFDAAMILLDEGKENKKLKIGIDLDDVVFEFVKGLIKYYKLKTGKELIFEQFQSYDISKTLNIPLEEVLQLVGEMATPEFNLSMAFCEFAKESILKLSKNNDVYFITSRIHKEGTKESLDKYFSEIYFELIFSSNPYAKTLGKHKGEICLELGIDFMIEDSYEHAINCANFGVKCFLLEKPWNVSSEKHENIIRVKDWKEVLVKLGEIKNE